MSININRELVVLCVVPEIRISFLIELNISHPKESSELKESNSKVLIWIPDTTN